MCYVAGLYRFYASKQFLLIFQINGYLYLCQPALLILYSPDRKSVV